MLGALGLWLPAQRMARPVAEMHCGYQPQTSRQGVLATLVITAEVIPASQVLAGGAVAVGGVEHDTRAATTQRPCSSACLNSRERRSCRGKTREDKRPAKRSTSGAPGLAMYACMLSA